MTELKKAQNERNKAFKDATQKDVLIEIGQMIYFIHKDLETIKNKLKDGNN